MTDTRPPRKAKILATQQSVDSAIWAICDVMRRGNVTSAKEYVAELTWILFLRILDETEAREEQVAGALGTPYVPSLGTPYRWTDWARPISARADKTETNRRRQLVESGSGKMLEFVNGKLLPYLKKLGKRPDATPRQKVISEVVSGVDRAAIDTETNLLEVLDKVHEISQNDIDPTHVFALSQVYEGERIGSEHGTRPQAGVTLAKVNASLGSGVNACSIGRARAFPQVHRRGRRGGDS
jgi:type I restriction enzyme M protein